MQTVLPLSLIAHYHSAAPELQQDDIRTESAYRAACERRFFAHGFDTLPVIRRIGAPGALGFRFGGDTQDDRILTNFLIKMLRAGLRVSPDFEIDCINFQHKRDFLAEAWPYDALAICFIVGFGPADSLNSPLRTFDPAKSDPQTLGFTLSPHHNQARWQERIRSSGARLVMTYGSGQEISTRDLEAPHFLTELLPSTTSPSVFNQGYLARPDFIEAYRSHASAPLNETTLLGQALLTRPGFTCGGVERIDAIFNCRA